MTSELPIPILQFFPSYRLSLYRLGTDRAENTCHVSDCWFIGPLPALDTVRTTENSAPVLLAACVLRALPSNVFMCHTMLDTIDRETHNRKKLVGKEYHFRRTLEYSNFSTKKNILNKTELETSVDRAGKIWYSTPSIESRSMPLMSRPVASIELSMHLHQFDAKCLTRPISLCL